MSVFHRVVAFQLYLVDKSSRNRESSTLNLRQVTLSTRDVVPGSRVYNPRAVRNGPQFYLRC